MPGFAPAGRGPFVSAKGPKTIDAQFGRIRLVGYAGSEGRANSHALKQGPPGI